MAEEASNEKDLNLPDNTSEISKEWNLFWKSLRSRDLPDIEEGDEEYVKPMTLEQIHELTKSLSAEKKQLHRKLENLNKEIDLNTTKLETLRLVGSDDQDTLVRINELSDQGMAITSRLQEIDDQIKEVRGFEEKIIDALE